jgi:hypothetical protein
MAVPGGGIIMLQCNIRATAGWIVEYSALRPGIAHLVPRARLRHHGFRCSILIEDPQKERNMSQEKNQGELSDQQLDNVSGGQEIRKMEKIVVTAKRSDANPQQVVKMEKVVVTATRDSKEPADLGGAQIAQVDSKK